MRRHSADPGTTYRQQQYTNTTEKETDPLLVDANTRANHSIKVNGTGKGKLYQGDNNNNVTIISHGREEKSIFFDSDPLLRDSSSLQHQQKHHKEKHKQKHQQRKNNDVLVSSSSSSSKVRSVNIISPESSDADPTESEDFFDFNRFHMPMCLSLSSLHALY